MPQTILAENTILFVVLAGLSLAILVWRVKPVAFRALSSKQLAVASALFWGLLATVLVFTFWESYYSQFISSGQRWLILLGAISVYPLWSLFLKWLALRLPGNPVAAFCLLGGLQSFPEHAIAIYRSEILDLPILQGSTPLSIFIFAYFEYLVFWSLVLALALVLQRVFKLRS